MDVPTSEARAISGTMPKLKLLNIAHLNINTPVLLEIISGCPDLEWLYILGCVNVEPKLFKKKHPKLTVWGPYDNYGFFDGQESEYSEEDEQWDTWNWASSSSESSPERLPCFDPYDIDAYNDYYSGC